MDYELFSYRNADAIFQNDPTYTTEWAEMLQTLDGISEQDIIDRFNADQAAGAYNKSISRAINELIKERLMAIGWHPESYIFQDAAYQDKAWRLDFAKGEFSVEVAFNHGEATSWNLLKPVLAGELNHVQKAIQTSAGIIICATEDMKYAGNFDGAVGTYEKFVQYLKPLRNVLTIPMAIIGLKKPTTFCIPNGSKSHGAQIQMLGRDLFAEMGF